MTAIQIRQLKNALERIAYTFWGLGLVFGVLWIPTQATWVLVIGFLFMWVALCFAMSKVRIKDAAQ